MRKLAFGAITLIGLLTAACGDDGDGPTLDPDADTSPDATSVCNPVSNTGCDAGQKCTWINITDELGTIGCVEDGTVETNGACEYGDLGESTGFDNCVHGNICIGGLCEGTCVLATGEGCDANSNCSAYNIFANGEENPAYGACDANCDPVTQDRWDDAAMCGSTAESIAAGTPNRGCFLNFDDNGLPADPGGCAPVPGTVNNAHATNPFTQDANGYGPDGLVPSQDITAYSNGCEAGYAPLLRSANNTTAPLICMAYCLPGETYLGNDANENGLDGSAYECEDRGAATHECQYFWLFEGSATIPPTHTDGIGFCWTPENYLIALQDDEVEDDPWPRCGDIPNTDNDDPPNGIPDHLDWACAPYPEEALHGGPKPVVKAKLPFKPVTGKRQAR